jgi:predicted nucleotide-binding protein
MNTVMKDRFAGEVGRRVLIDALRDQTIVGGNEALANEIATAGELLDIRGGTALMEQGGDDNDIYLILAGSFKIVINGRDVATRGPNKCVGEMAAVQPTQRRSAAVISAEDSVVCKLTEPQLADLGTRHPEIFRQLAKEMARRLLQRNALVSATHDKIRVFIVSSVEALSIARAIQNAFEHDPFTVTVWTDGVFRVANYAIESLEQQLDQSDFAIAIAQPDDLTESRGESKPSPRDNVIFELGFFMGRLGRHRALLLEPRGEEVKLPSDLAGLTTVPYKYGDGRDLPAAMGPACNRIREIIQELGPNN